MDPTLVVVIIWLVACAVSASVWLMLPRSATTKLHPIVFQIDTAAQQSRGLGPFLGPIRMADPNSRMLVRTCEDHGTGLHVAPSRTLFSSTNAPSCAICCEPTRASPRLAKIAERLGQRVRAS